MKKILLVAVAGAIVAFTAWQVARAWRTDDARLRALVDGCVEAARERSARKLLAFVDDENYADEVHRDRNALRDSLNYLALTVKAVHVDVTEGPVVVIDDDGGTAMVTLRANVLIGYRADAPPTDTLVQDARKTDWFRLHCRKADGDWFITRVDSPPAP